MLAHEITGTGSPLLLLHGTPSSRAEWAPIVPRLSEHRRLILVDLPGFGDSPPAGSGALPGDWVKPIHELLDSLGLKRCAVLGSSMGGWTALELARVGLATSVVALAPAGLWRERSPRLTNVQLVAGQALARAVPEAVLGTALRSPSLRRLALRSASVDASRVSAETAAAFALGPRRATGWREHYLAAKETRFRGGRSIEVPVKVVWGGSDPIAPAAKSRHVDQLPAHASIETWEECGHLIAWDAPDRLVEAVLRGRAVSSDPSPGPDLVQTTSDAFRHPDSHLRRLSRRRSACLSPLLAI